MMHKHADTYCRGATGVNFPKMHEILWEPQRNVRIVTFARNSCLTAVPLNVILSALRERLRSSFRLTAPLHISRGMKAACVSKRP